MNFLDPSGWADLEQLEKQYQNLDENLVKELHAKLRPYFLRRNKCDVLDLPPKVGETIVLCSFAHALSRTRLLCPFQWRLCKEKFTNLS